MDVCSTSRELSVQKAEAKSQPWPLNHHDGLEGLGDSVSLQHSPQRVLCGYGSPRVVTGAGTAASLGTWAAWPRMFTLSSIDRLGLPSGTGSRAEDGERDAPGALDGDNSGLVEGGISV